VRRKSLMKREWISIILLTVFAAALFLFGLGRMALTDPDEPFYAETAKEMLDRGEWLTPRIFGKPQFEKPVLYYWLIILSFKMFGINEFAARFPSAVFGILGVLGVYFLGRQLFSRKTAIYSSLVTISSILYIILSRACVTDMVLSTCITFAFLFYLLGYSKGHNKLFYLLSSLSLGLAVLTKGPIGVILPVFIIGLYLLLRKEFQAIRKFPYFSATIVFLAVSVPWYYLMYRVYGAEFIDHFFGFQNVTRFMSPEHRIGDVFYFYVPVVLCGFFPWSIFLPYGIHQIVKYDKANFTKHLFLLIWVAVFFVFFSISRTKLVTYIFPLFPALSIVAGRFLELTTEKGRFSLGEGISSVFYLISYPVAALVFYLVAANKYQVMVDGIFNTGIIFIGCVIVSALFLIRHNKQYFYGSIVGTIAVGVIPLVMFLADPISEYESSKYFARELKKVSKPGERIGAETDYRRGLAFYMDREDVIDIHVHDVVIKFLASDDRVWGLKKDKNHFQLYTNKKQPFKKPTYIIYESGKKVLITNKVPADGAFIRERVYEDAI